MHLGLRRVLGGVEAPLASYRPPDAVVVRAVGGG